MRLPLAVLVVAQQAHLRLLTVRLEQPTKGVQVATTLAPSLLVVVVVRASQVATVPQDLSVVLVVLVSHHLSQEHQSLVAVAVAVHQITVVVLVAQVAEVQVGLQVSQVSQAQ
jgi:hypothetical protein